MGLIYVTEQLNYNGIGLKPNREVYSWTNRTVWDVDFIPVENWRCCDVESISFIFYYPRFMLHFSVLYVYGYTYKFIRIALWTQFIYESIKYAVCKACIFYYLNCILCTYGFYVPIFCKFHFMRLIIINVHMKFGLKNKFLSKEI